MNYLEAQNYIEEKSRLGIVPGLTQVKELLRRLGNPQDACRTLHIAGTNGKGSIFAFVQESLLAAGYHVGRYISPTILTYLERYKLDRRYMTEDEFAVLLTEVAAVIETMETDGFASPTVFEIETAVAFLYFARNHVDYVLLECGMGGSQDATNVLAKPEICVFAQISMDHMQFLGDTLTKIATEKAGIIKDYVPVVIGETTPETRPVFEEKAWKAHAPLIFAEEEQLLKDARQNADGTWTYQTSDYPDLQGELGGYYQLKNTNTLLSAIRQLKQAGYSISEANVREGFAHVCSLTGLMGRWQKLGSNPTIVCDTGHNTGGIRYIVEQLRNQTYDTLHIVIGMVNDKDISGVLAMLPKEARYYFTQASVQRALPADKVKELAASHGLKGESYPDVATALKAAQSEATEKDFIFVGGSSFIVADLLSLNK